MKKASKLVGSVLMMSLLFLNSCNEKKYSQITDSSNNGELKDPLIEADYGKLLAPQNLSINIENFVLSWNKVGSASSYDININGKLVANVQNNSYSLDKYFKDPSTSKNNLISIRAISEDGTIKSNFTSFEFNPSTVERISKFSFELDEEKQEYGINGFNPAIDATEYTVLEFDTTFNDLPVTFIADKAFNNTKITTITFPSSIKRIGNNAFSNNRELSKITFSEGLEEIGNSSFEACQNPALNKVNAINQFPDSLTKIGNKAFFNTNMAAFSFTEASKLKEIGTSAFESTQIATIKLPASVESIGKHAFKISRLNSLSFAENSKLEEIGEYAFQGSKIKDVYIPTSVNTIKEGAFLSCTALNNVYFTDDTMLKSIEKEAFKSSGIRYFGKESEKNNYDFTVPAGEKRYKNVAILNLPSSVVSMGVSAFASVGFTRIDFAADSQLYEIGDSCFSGIRTLESINFPSSLKRIGASCFSLNSAATYSLENVSFSQGCALEYLGKDAFNNTNYVLNQLNANPDSKIVIGGALYKIPASEKELSSVIIEEGITAICESLYENAKMQTLSLPSTLLSIGNSSFTRCTNLTSLTLPANLKTISSNAFSYCTKISNLVIPETSNLETIGDSSFMNCNNISSVNFPSSLLSIGNSAFSVSSNANLQFANFPINASLNKIGNNAFSNQTKLETFDVSNSVVNIGNSAFSGCTGLKNINISVSESKLETIGDSAFLNSGLVSISLPDSLQLLDKNVFKNCRDLVNVEFGSLAFSKSENKEILSGTFENCTSLVTITLPSHITTISSNAFLNASKLEEIISEATIFYQDSFKNTAYEKTFSTGFVEYNGYVISYIGNDKNLVLEEGVTSIYNGAFANNNFESITLPKSITYIGDNAFANCRKLQKVIIPSDAKLTNIGENAFLNCTSLEMIALSNKLQSIGSHAFDNCYNLKEIAFTSNEIKEISEYAFYRCNALTKLSLSDGIETIKPYAFAYCSIEKVEFPKTLKEIHDYAFAFNGKATNPSFNIDDWVINNYALTNITFTEDCHLELIGKYAFTNNNIVSIELPKSEGLYLDEYCFANSYSLNVFLLEDGVILTEGVINGANNITQVELPGDVVLATLFGGNVGSVPTSLKSIIVADGSDFIVDNAFAGLGMVDSIVLPNTIQKIGNNAFYGCKNIKNLNLLNVQSIGANAFTGCINLGEIKLSNELNYIGNKAFLTTKYLNSNSDEFVIINGILVQYNGDSNEVVIPNNVTMIAGGAFSGNHKVSKITLSSNTTYLANGAFDSCTNLKEIIIANTKMTEIELKIFDSLSASLKIYVFNDISVYEEDLNWSLYLDYLVRA